MPETIRFLWFFCLGTQRMVAVQAFSQLHGQSHAFHSASSVGSLTKTIDRGIRGIQTVFTTTSFNLLPTLIEVTLVCGVMAMKIGGLSVAVVGGTLAAYSAYTLKITSWRTKFRREMNGADAEAASIATDSLLNQEAVKLVGPDGLAYERKRYDRALARYQSAANKTAGSLSLLNTGQQIILTSGMIAVMTLCSAGILAGKATLGDLVLVNGLMYQLGLPLNFLGSMYRDLRQALIDVQALLDLTTPKASNSATLSLPSGQQNKVAPVPVPQQADIHFDNVYFAHTNSSIDSRKNSLAREETKKGALRGLTLTIKAGQKTALVGPSGSGKSTVGRLLTKILDLHSDPLYRGRIQLIPHSASNMGTAGALDFGSVDGDEWRKHLAIVQQEGALFNTSIAQNICYPQDFLYNPELSMEDLETEECELDPAEIMRQEYGMRKAMQMARFEDVAEGLPQGLLTRVGERGMLLSGGERQRLAIARAVYRLRLLLREKDLPMLRLGDLFEPHERIPELQEPSEPPIMPLLVMDEATSALDTPTEQAIIRSLNALRIEPPAKPDEITTSSTTHRQTAPRNNQATNRAEENGRFSSLWIAHRLSTITDAQCIYVMDHGRVVQSGTHGELMQDTTGLYYRMYTAQQQEQSVHA